MKICIAHNEYGKFSGEEAVVHSQLLCLSDRRGGEVPHGYRALFGG